MALGVLAGPAAAVASADSTVESPTPTPDPDTTASASFAGPSSPTSAFAQGTTEAVPTANDSERAEDGVELTLVTGETLEIVETPEGERVISSDTPADLHQLDAPDGTYVFPTDVDFSVFDPDLFNIDLLLEQGLSDEESGGIPVIVDAQEIREYHFDGESIPDTEVSGYKQSASLESIGAEAGKIEKSDAATTIEELFDTYAVESIHLDRQVNVALDTSVDAIGGEQVRDDFDLNGSGVTVAVLDTGVDATHPDIDVVDQKDFTGDGIGDVHGHGTHVAGTVAGDGNMSDGEYVGVAPGADILDVKVLDDFGGGNISEIIEGMEAAVHADADIISMSLGGAEPTDDPFVDAVESAVDANVTVVAAGGNAGPDYRTIGSPGAVHDALTVGAYDHQADEVAPFSSKGPTIHHSLVKPDLLAPGVGITAPVPGEEYATFDGTSMATPHVSGALALMLEQDEALTPTQKRDILLSNADVLDGDIYTQGAGHLNLTRSIQPDLIVENATHSLGGVSDNETIERTITIENPTNESIDLDVTGTLTNIETGTDHHENLTPVSSNISIDPESTDTIDFHVETDVPGGIYSGVVTLESEDRPHAYTIPVGFVRGEDITIEKLPLTEGESTDDQIAVLTETGPMLSMLEDGEANYFLGDGEYTVWSPGYDDTADRFVMSSKQFDVDGPETFTLDENETARLDFDDEHLEEDLHTLEAHADFTTEFEVLSDPAIFRLGTILPHTDTIRVSEDDSLDVGLHRLSAPDEQVSDNGENHSHPAVSDVYLTSQFEDGVDDPETFAPDIEELAKEDRTYHRTTLDQHLALQWGMFEDEFGQTMLGLPFSLADRVNQTIYASEETTYLSNLRNEIGETEIDRSDLDADEQPEVDVSRGPLTGYLDVDISADDIATEGAFMTDQSVFAHTYDAFGVANYYEVAVNNETVVDGPTGAPIFETDEEIDLDDKDQVQVVAFGDNPNDALSTQVITVAEVNYSVDGNDNTPPQIVGIDVPVNEYNVVTDEKVPVTVTVESTDGIDLDAVDSQIADGDVESEPFGDDEEWNAIDEWEIIDGNEEIYVLQTELNLSQYTDRPHLAIRVKDDGGDVGGALTRNAFWLDDPEPHDPVEPDLEEISGELTRADGTPAANDLVVVNRLDVEDGYWYAEAMANEEGEFSVEVTEGGLYDLTYLQLNGSGAPDEMFPHDGNVDVHPLATVDLSDDEASAVDEFESVEKAEVPGGMATSATLIDGVSSDDTIETSDPDLGAVQLPAGHVLDVQVTNEDDEPIDGAHAAYEVGEDGFLPAPLGLETNEDGYATWQDREDTGLEVNGSVSIAPEPPRTVTYSPDTETDTVEVDEDTVLTVELAERDILSVPEDEATIQDAVDNATEKDLIVVADGEYEEEVVIDDAVAITSESALEGDTDVGAPDETATLQGDGTGTAFTITAGVESVFIEGFEITDYEEGILAEQGETDEVTLRDNSIKNVDDGVLAISPEQAAPHHNWLIERNVVDEPGVLGIGLLDVEIGIVAENEIHGDGVVTETEASGEMTDRGLEPTHSGEGGTHSGIVGISEDGFSEFIVSENQLTGSFNETGIATIADGGDLGGVVDGNTLEGEYQFNNIFAGADHGGSVAFIEVAHNDIAGTSEPPAVGVEPFDESSWIDEITIEENHIDASNDGIGVASPEDGGYVNSVEIAGNEITAGDTGIFALTAAHELGWIGIFDNEIEDAEVGILAESWVDTDPEERVIPVDVADNHLEANEIGIAGAGAGVYIDIWHTSVVDNEDGVFATEEAFLTISDSVITDNMVGVNASGDAFVDAWENDIAGNEDFGARVEAGTAFIDASYNWWGENSGPHHPEKNADGEGDQVSDNVEFEPWLVDDEDTITVTGTLELPDDSPGVNDMVLATTTERVVWEETFTDEDGEFTLDIPADVRVSISVIPVGADGIFTRDSIVDLYEITELQSSEDVHLDETLPEGHVVNITAVDEADDPVENATVAITHWQEPTVKGASVENQTNEHGMFQVNSDHPGAELVGTISIEVTPPEDDDRFADEVKFKEISVDDDKEVTVVLEGPEPSVADYTNEDDIVDTDGLRDAVSEWRSGEIDTDLLREVVSYWRSGEVVG